ncbi:uncharacterized protein PHACADRAFT_206567 [Phanerochaete carnosa HHB-10118-sp]|uniref:Uncharacterized protein n=1 Tax=Phanerochaete carnosa (strain HHB-10118-sp) TaxID=650164 RepID=K5W1F3_PHACS|nr:uncharacterized protein PHACADRAFT_206567 [Phanerochaete carnosa HHB-10118-sp]EKM57688.1 hypothetical protein PHACADRAFT_206567 [Phanerochaete carnosa HHB-10118-sp]
MSYRGAFALTGFIEAALFSALRVFAISDRSHVWSFLVFALSTITSVLSLIATIISKSIVAVDEQHAVDPDVIYSQSRIARGSLILADTIVLALTWIKTFGNWRQARSVNVQVSLTTCLLRNGTIYFIAPLVIILIQLLIYASTAVTPPVGAFISSLPLVLINRFMSNLQTAGSEMPGYSVRIADQRQLEQQVNEKSVDAHQWLLRVDIYQKESVALASTSARRRSARISWQSLIHGWNINAVMIDEEKRPSAAFSMQVHAGLATLIAPDTIEAKLINDKLDSFTIQGSAPCR